MNDVLLRFKIVKNNYVFEALFDERLSFKDNLKIISKMLDSELENMMIYDQEKKLFLNDDIELRKYNIKSFMFFYLF